MAHTDRLKIEKKGENKGIELEEFKFAARALGKSKGEMRPHIKYLYIEKNIVSATDGRRLHVFNTAYELDSGFYEVVKNTAACIYIIKTDIDSEYPEFKAVLDESKNHVPLEITFGAMKESCDATITLIVRQIYPTKFVRFKFIKDVLASNSWDWSIYIPSSEEDYSIIFKQTRICRTNRK